MLRSIASRFLFAMPAGPAIHPTRRLLFPFTGCYSHSIVPGGLFVKS